MSLADRFYADPYAEVDTALGMAKGLRDRRAAGRLHAVRAGIAGRTGDSPRNDLQAAAAEILATGGEFTVRDLTLVAIALIGAPSRAADVMRRMSSGFRAPSSSIAPGKARRARLIWSAACVLAGREDEALLPARSKTNPISAILAGDAGPARKAIDRDCARVMRLRSRGDQVPEKHLPVDGLLLGTVARRRGLSVDDPTWRSAH